MTLASSSEASSLDQGGPQPQSPQPPLKDNIDSDSKHPRDSSTYTLDSSFDETAPYEHQLPRSSNAEAGTSFGNSVIIRSPDEIKDDLDTQEFPHVNADPGHPKADEANSNGITNGLEEAFPSHVVNFPNGNSSSAFPNLSAVDEVAQGVLLDSSDNIPAQELPSLADPLNQELNSRSVSPPKKAKSQERRNRAEEFTSENNTFKYVPNFKYKYSGTENFRTELEEWFLYEDNELLPSLKFQFQKHHDNDWRYLSLKDRVSLLQSWLSDLESLDDTTRRNSLAFITYVSLGSYASITSTEDHISEIKSNTKFLWKHGALIPLYSLLIRNIDLKVPPSLYKFDLDEDDNSRSSSSSTDAENELNIELFSVLTTIYFIIESNRSDTEFAADLDKLNPKIMLFFIQAIGRVRWGIEGNLPLRPIFLIFWKCMLCLFGNDDTLAHVKKYMLKKYNLPENVDPNLVMSSPLDYHAFRQDMMSRYPSYIPPSSRLPKNFDNSRSMSHFIEVPRPVIAQSSNSALPIPTVHIATPAPSPPSSPAIAAGQKVRKSVFMTNQSFPFIHPTESNIPQSIVEASELFHSRIHTTPSMVQLWNERDKFMQQERGWIPAPRELHDFEESFPEELILERVEDLYINSMGDLNSFVLVLLKFLLANASFSSSESHIDTYLAANQYAGPAFRAKDIGLKAVSACILTLSNWFKVSHICKFEHLSTLLFDSRYHLLVFKYFYSHVPFEKAQQILDDPSLAFFSYASGLSDAWDDTNHEEEPEEENSASEDEGEISQDQNHNDEELNNDDGVLGAQVRICPKVYSRRYFFITINLLRILRKITRKKTQRIIVVAELPPDTLKKALSIYQQDIWEIVLEMFKEQVPFNGRKWRTTNMDLVSAIYLHCKTKLRDDWLLSGDLNAEAEDAQPQEIAIRALIQFYNERLRKEYLKKQLEVGNDGSDRETTNDEEPPNFFALELDALALDNAPI